ncbi:MAG: glycosyl transferase family 1 [Tepidiforma sp.]|nr:glycosyltransferase family 1 protein [Tepidiforma sp.]GIW18459.1 MAG: glycosyl transferase family 1 [Tepidiforma sp.]
MPNVLRVALDASALPARPAGAGVYMLELAAALAARPSLEVTAFAPRPLPGCCHRPVPAGSPARRFAWQLRSLGPAVAGSGAHLLHGLHFYTPRRLPVPAVTTIHDLTFFRIPRRYPPSRRWYYRLIAHTARFAGRVIVPSSAVAQDAVRYLGLPAERIRVIPEAPRAGLRAADPARVAAARAKYALGDAPYLLCLGTAEPGKRAVDALRALPAIRERHPGVLLALAGNPGPLLGPLQREAARLGVAEAVRWLGYVPDGDLPALLTGATALVFPSLFEGFGLPPLEAMACGTPVIAVEAPAMSEVLAGAALFVPLRSPAAIAAEASRLLADPAFRADLAHRALQHAARLSWANAADLTESVYRELVP